MTRDSNIENENLLEKLLKFNSETEWIEFKESNSKPDEIGEYLSALGNSACLLDQKLGYLVFGIQNEKRLLVGTKCEPKKMKVGNEEFENWLSRLLDPRVDFEISEFKVDDKSIVIIAVDAARGRPTKFKGTAYVLYCSPLVRSRS
jgi:predicted HTH transcriptional regulator